MTLVGVHLSRLSDSFPSRCVSLNVLRDQLSLEFTRTLDRVTEIFSVYSNDTWNYPKREMKTINPILCRYKRYRGSWFSINVDSPILCY